MPITPTDFDNAEIDLQTTSIVSNSKTLSGAPADSTLTRLGDTVDTLNGRLKKLGYTPPIAYAASISFGALDNVKTIEEAGVIYAPKPSALPFTTSGTFVGDDDARFFVVQGVITSMLAAEFADVANMKTATTTSGISIAWSDYLGRDVTVVVNNTTTNKGSARYTIANVDPGNLSTLTSGIWVGANHDLGGGFYAKIISDAPNAFMFGYTSVASDVYESMDEYIVSAGIGRHDSVSATRFGQGKKFEIFLPSVFSGFAIDPKINWNGSRWTCGFDVRSLRGGYASEVYVDPIFGDDTTGDGSESDPYKTVAKAVDTTTDKTIYLAAGEYPYIYGPQDRIDPQNMDFICKNGVAEFTNGIIPRDWRHISQNPANLYFDSTIPEADRPEINNSDFIVDRATGKAWYFTKESNGGTPVPANAKVSTLDSSGNMVTDGALNCTLIDASAIYYIETVYQGEDLNAVSNSLRATLDASNSRTVAGDQLSFGVSIQDVVENPHHWRTDSAITIVHCAGSFSPVGRVSIRYALENIAVIDQDGSFGDMALYFENIKTSYGAPSSFRIFNGTSDSSLVCVNCDFRNGQSSNTFEQYGHGLTVMWGCSATGAFKDGFNYHVNTANTGLTDMDIIEVDCVARNNGRGSTGTNNGSTAHETARIIRINGDYSENQNRNIQDINVVKAMLISCTSRFGAEADNRDLVFGRDTSEVDNVHVYMIDCVSDKVSYEYGTQAFIHNSNMFENENIDPDATKNDFVFSAI